SWLSCPRRRSGSTAKTGPKRTVSGTLRGSSRPFSSEASVPHTATGRTGTGTRRSRKPTPASARFIPGEPALVPSTQRMRRPPRGDVLGPLEAKQPPVHAAKSDPETAGDEPVAHGTAAVIADREAARETAGQGRRSAACELFGHPAMVAAPPPGAPFMGSVD